MCSGTVRITRGDHRRLDSRTTAERWEGILGKHILAKFHLVFEFMSL